MELTGSDLKALAVQLALELWRSLEAEQIAHRACQEALTASEDVRWGVERWNERLRVSLAVVLIYASAVTIALVWAVMR